MSFNQWSTVADLTNAPARRRPRSAAELRLDRLYRHLFLWVLQIWLAFFYIGAGYTKLSQSQQILGLMMTWPERVNLGLVHRAGWTEIILALAVVSPILSWRRLKPVLYVGATLLLINALGMTLFHSGEGQSFNAVVNLFLAVAALTVMIGRWRQDHAQSA